MANDTIQPGGELFIRAADTYVPLWGIAVDATGNDIKVKRYNSSGVLQDDDCLTLDWATGSVAFGSGLDLTSLDDLTVADVVISGTFTHANLVAPAANAACAILNTTTQIVLTVTDGTNTAISTTSSVAGQRVTLVATAVSGGGSYTLALVSGTLTLNSTGETALIERVNAADGWRAIALTAGTAGGNAATVV